MKPHTRILFAAWLTATALSPFVGAQSPAATLFQEGLTLERAEGKLKDAIFRYERVVAEFSADREVAPRALYQLALAYERLNNPRATLLLARLVTEYPSSSPYAADARKKLAATQSMMTGPFAMQTMDAEAEVGSPDGKLVIYHRNNRSSGRLYARDLATGTERVIVDLDGFVGPYVFSPDSRRLAFSLQDPAKGINETRIVTLATGESRTLALRSQMLAGWTTKGDLAVLRVTFATNSADVVLASADTGAERKVLTMSLRDIGSGPPGITRDGESLIVGKSRQLVVIDLATGIERAVTLGSGEETRPIMSPDSRLLAFASNRDGRWAMYVVPLDRIPVRDPVRIGALDEVGLGGNRTGGHLDWLTSDGLLTMVLNPTESNVYRIAMDPATGRATGAPERLTQDAARNHNPAIGPDGKHIAYYYRTGTKGGIAVMDANGVSERPLVEQSGNMPLFWRAPDEVLFYDFATPAGQKPAITSLNINTGAQKPIAQVDGLSWVYVPARQEILHLPSSMRPATVLKAFSLADGTGRTVATIDYLSPWMSVSPNGKHIAYSVYPGGNADACEMSLMSSEGVFEKVLVPQQKNCGGPTAWSPNGKYLMLTTTTSPRVLDLGTLQSWPLHRDIENEAGWRPGNWGPDGAFVVASRQTSRVERLAWKGVTYDAVVRLLGGK